MGRAAKRTWLAAAAVAIATTVGLSGPLALAEEPEATPPGEAQPPAEAPGAEAPAESPAGEAPKEGEVVTPSEAVQGQGSGWKDIVVVPRRAILKRRRLEIAPDYQVTMNNTLVRHHGVGGSVNFYLSESLFIGLEGHWYQKQLLDRYYLIGLDQRVLASVNRYNWSAFLDFGYIPIYGKFNLFDKAILHWDVWIAGGVGVFNTEIIPKDPANASFGGYRIAGLLPGIGSHLWFNRWLGFDVYVKSYLFADKLEGQRMSGDCPSSSNCPAADKAQSQITFDLVFGVGFSVMLPPGYEYKTPR